MRHALLVAVVAAALSAATPAASNPAPSKTASSQPVLFEMKVRDLAVHFLEFYQAANTPAPMPVAPPTSAPGTAPTPPAPVEAPADRRWRLFKQYYDFTDQASPEAARAALEAAWPRYADVMKQIESGFDGVAADLQMQVNSVASQLFLDQPMSLRFVTFVGTFEGRVWRDQDGDITNLYLPLEVDSKVRNLSATRLIAEAVMEKTAIWGKQPRNLAEYAVREGVIAKATATTLPGQPQERYLDLSPEALARARAAAKPSFRELAGKLGDAVPATLDADMQATLKLAGWTMVEGMTKQRGRLADMIRQKPADLVKVNAQILRKQVALMK
jgi:hypothetical protein